MIITAFTVFVLGSLVFGYAALQTAGVHQFGIPFGWPVFEVMAWSFVAVVAATPLVLYSIFEAVHRSLAAGRSDPQDAEIS